MRLLNSPSAAKPGKRGAKDYFTGSRREFLNSYRDEYISLRGRSRSKFWHKLYKEWWQTYPWRLPDDEEPPIDDPEKMEELSRVSDNNELERDLKHGVEKRLQQVSPLHSPDLASLVTIGTISVEDHHVV